ncbi:MAG: CPBP family intramembrane glutamic endopeptidase [Candidatus Hodarchaeota archaeon]
MPNEELNLLKLAKFVNQEIFIEELFRVKPEKLLKKYSKKKKLLKIKILFTKIFYSVFFGILPIIPLMTYFEMKAGIISEYPIEMVVFSGGLLFLFFFILQFFNVFFMGMIEASLIMSNSLFYWLETLPISSQKLRKLKIISIFRNFDLPLIVITFGFPIAMFIGTLNVLVFLICLGISILQNIAIFSALIIFGERINRFVDMNIANSRKTTIIRLINIFGFVIIFFGSLIFVQWAMRSLDIFFRFPMVQEKPALINLILSTIPFSSTSYLTTYITTGSQFHFVFWFGIFCGLGLFIIFTYWIFTKALSGLHRITSSKGDILKKYKVSYIVQEQNQINIKIRKPIRSHFFKDLTITSRNLKVFLSVVTPIIISFVFTYTFNFTVLEGQTPLTSDFIYNWSVIIAFQPIVCGMLIYNLLNLEESGDPIFLSLPIIPKNRAKSKLLFFIIIQTISVISPYLIYMFELNFINLFITVLISLPFAWLILITMFEMRIYFFGRAKYRFVLEQVNPENRMIKWASIYILEYILTIIIISTGMTLIYLGIEYFISIFILVMFFCYCILFLSFKIIFSPVRKPKRRRTPKLSLDKKEYKLVPIKTFFIDYPWISITLLILFNFILVYLGNLYLRFIYYLKPINRFQIILWYTIFPMLIFVLIKINFISKLKGTIYDKSGILYDKSKYWKLGIFGFIFIYIFSFLFLTSFSFYGRTTPDFYKIFVSIVFALWIEILFRGIIFPILLSKYNRITSLFLNSFIFFLYYLIYYITFSIALKIFTSYVFVEFFYVCVINFFLTYLYSKQNSISPAVFIHLISTLLGTLPLFYFGIYFFFSL